MAGTSLLTLIDDIATILDDVSVMTKVAAKKTAGVLGDDLALNAQQVAGVQADREIPVVLAVAKGSAINKLILVPSALLISFFLPWLITPLLMLGGLFLCFEGAEKLVHKYLHADEADDHAARVAALADANVDMVAFEKEKIKGAVRTDFILSAEIIVIALGSAAGATLLNQTLVLVIISVAMTVGVYGLVAGIVKIDDLGLHLLKKTSNAAKTTGRLLLAAAPKLMKFLSVAGTIAMFLVGGGILVHGVPALHHGVEDLSHLTGMFSSVTGALLNGLVGLLAGGLVVVILMLFQKLRGTAAH
jgi:predicted DNA repair protein MutK